MCKSETNEMGMCQTFGEVRKMDGLVTIQETGDLNTCKTPNFSEQIWYCRVLEVVSFHLCNRYSLLQNHKSRGWSQS